MNAREKTDSTKVFVRVDATRPSARIMVYGYIPGSGGVMSWKNCTCKTSSGNSYVVARPGVNSSIRTTVYEDGGRSAKLRGRSVSGTAMTGGQWSPDSLGVYEILNP